MNVIEWLLGGQNNPSAGAIDVIAVRRADGTIACSPFHVKLSKGAKRGEKKIVKIHVNGTESKVSMKLGVAGEAFFVERTRDDIGREFCASPPGSPIPTGLISHEHAAERGNDQCEAATSVPSANSLSFGGRLVSKDSAQDTTDDR